MKTTQSPVCSLFGPTTQRRSPTFAAMTDTRRGTAGYVDVLRATGAAGAEEPGAEHAGAVEPSGDSLLSAVLAAAQVLSDFPNQS